MGELPAAHDDEVLAWPLLEVTHYLRNLALQQGGVDPRQRLSERRGADILLQVVEHCRHGVTFSLRPDGVEVLVGPPAQQQRADGGNAIPSVLHRRIGHGPATMLESATAVLIRPAWRLHDSIEGQLSQGNDLT